MATLVYLKGFLGTYASAQPDGMLECNREKPQSWETFAMENAGPEKVWDAFLTSHLQGHRVSFKSVKFGKYLSAQDDGRMEANRDERRSWEIFDMEAAGENENLWSFKSSLGRFMSAKHSGRLECNVDKVEERERFVVELAPAIVNLKTWHHKYMCVGADGKALCDRGEPAQGETTFSMEVTAPGKVAFKSTKTGKYLSAKQDSTVALDSDKCGESEQFAYWPLGGNTFAFKAAHGKWLSAFSDYTMRCMGDKPGEWEGLIITTADMAQTAA